jgi:hypothetical protein
VDLLGGCAAVLELVEDMQKRPRARAAFLAQLPQRRDYLATFGTALLAHRADLGSHLAQLVSLLAPDALMPARDVAHEFAEVALGHAEIVPRASGTLE